MLTRRHPSFNARTFLESSGIARTVTEFRPGGRIFTQGQISDTVMYLQKGVVKLSAVAPSGREAVVALLGPGDFFGEGSLAAQPLRRESATALTASTILFIDKPDMIRLLHTQHRFSDRFITHLLARQIRIEEDLADQLFNFSEKRIARALVRFARFGKQNTRNCAVGKISQATLATMVGTTRSRVNFFMTKFKKLGFITYEGKISGDLTINDSLLSSVLID